MFQLRIATHDDIPAIQSLIADSVRGLSAGFYTPEQAESGLRYVFGVDTQLIQDGTYYVVEAPDGIAAAGGWSRRHTLYGGDQMKGEADPLLDPARDAARIRAFFVHPAWARRGLGRLLFERCQEDARAAGFGRFELLATAPGEPLYAALGFAVVERPPTVLPDGQSLPVAVMTRPIG